MAVLYHPETNVAGKKSPPPIERKGSSPPEALKPRGAPEAEAMAWAAPLALAPEDREKPLVDFYPDQAIIILGWPEPKD